jgi:hypothetical protein
MTSIQHTAHFYECELAKYRRAIQIIRSHLNTSCKKSGASQRQGLIGLLPQSNGIVYIGCYALEYALFFDLNWKLGFKAWSSNMYRRILVVMEQ